MKRLLTLLLAGLMLIALTACKSLTVDPTEPELSDAITEPEEDIRCFDLNEIDLEGIGELLAQQDETAVSRIRLEGLCTPVELELQGTELLSVTAYGLTATVSPAAEGYTSIYGNLWPVIYDYEDLIVLNIWYDDIGYTCVMFPDHSYIENYPDGEYSVMVYEEEGGGLVQYQFAMKFLGIDQWDTGPIDQATGRDDFYYSIDDARWDGEVFHVISRDSYTISDGYALDEIFDTAKENGLYPDFETLDELLAYNTTEKGSGAQADSIREEVRYFDELRAVYEYDSNRNLITESFYTQVTDSVYFVKYHTYDEQNREIAGSWNFGGEEAYRYTNAYDEEGRLTETVWYQDDQEVERFIYTYQKKGYTETFCQNGQKQYSCTFDSTGQLTAHSIFKGNEEIKTDDVTGLVKTELLTDIWFPFMDNGTIHSPYRYLGTVPTLAPADALKTAEADGSYVLISEGVDEEENEAYRHEYHYSADDKLLRAVHIWDGVESYRDEYQYDSNGRCSLQVTYIDGEKDMTTERQYNSAGQLISIEREYADENYDYILTEEDGEEVTKEYTYTNRKETYRYNGQGLLAETVVYGDGQEIDRLTYEYDGNGYVLPSVDTYEYVYNAEGVLEGIWLIYDDYAAGMAKLRSRTVYVTAENANQLQEIMLRELSWF